MSFLESVTSLLTAYGLPASILGATLVLIVAWICVDFYEEHFG